MYLYLNTVLNKVFAIVFVFGKFIVFVFVFKYYAMYLDPSLGTCQLYHSLYAFTGSVCSYRAVGNFRGSNFSWFGELRQFHGFIFLWCAYSNHLVIWLKYSNFSWINRVHEIHENLNPMKITNHMVAILYCQ